MYGTLHVSDAYVIFLPLKQTWASSSMVITNSPSESWPDLGTWYMRHRTLLWLFVAPPAATGKQQESRATEATASNTILGIALILSC
jgi:hypothetical protein